MLCRNGEVPLPKIFFQNLHKKLDKPKITMKYSLIFVYSTCPQW